MANDTPAAFQERVADLAAKLELAPLAEQKLSIKKVKFELLDGTIRTLWATGKDMASRLFLQSLELGTNRRFVPPLLSELQTFYGFYWDDRPGTGAHPYIDLLKQSRYVTVFEDIDPIADVAWIIDSAWEARADLTVSTAGEFRDAVNHALFLLDQGIVRVAEPIESDWQVNQWLKKAVLLSFRLNDNVVMSGGFD